MALKLRPAAPEPGVRRLIDGASDLLHGGTCFPTEDLQDALDTRLTEGTKAPQIGPSDAYGLCAHGQCLDDVRAATEAAVYKNGHATADYLDDLRQDLDCRAAAIYDTLRHVRYGSKQ